MGILQAKIDITSSDLLNTPLALNTTRNLTVTQGGILLKEIDAVSDGTSVVLIAQADHAEGTKVYIRNRHAANTLNVKFVAANQIDLVIAPGQWTFFPWKAAVDLKVWASAADTIVEYGTFM
tara:strand:- start:445 stop:810 length:366 start_codon:yes stop_codon:yes gene_type:complete